MRQGFRWSLAAGLVNATERAETQAATVGERDAEYGRRRIAGSQLAGDDDRAQAEVVLRENFAAGRLELEELTTRATDIHAARTIGQLRDALEHLPGDPWIPVTPSPAAESQARTALMLAVVAVLVPAPPFAFGVASGWLALAALRGGVTVRRRQALAAAAIASVVTLIHAVVAVLWLAGGV